MRKNFNLASLLGALISSFANASEFVPPAIPMNEAEAYQTADALLSAKGFRVVHIVSAHFDPKSKSANIYEDWIDVPTRESRQELRNIQITGGEKNPLLNLAAILATKPDRGFWKTPHGDLKYSSDEDTWKPTIISASSSIGGVLRKIDKRWFLWSSFERTGGNGALCCGQIEPPGGDDYDARVKRHAALIKSVDAGASGHSFKEANGLVDDYRLAGFDGVVVWRIKNEYLKEWPFTLDEATKQAVQKLARVTFNSGELTRQAQSVPMPTAGRGFGVVFIAGPGGGVAHHVQENSPAAAAGIVAGDQVVSINGIAAVDSGANALQHMNDADTATFVLRRPNRSVYTVGIRKGDWSVMNPKKP